jgi:hypothetical protein
MLGSNYRCLWEAKVSKLQAAWCNQQQHCCQRLLGGWEAFGHFVGRDECFSAEVPHGTALKKLWSFWDPSIPMLRIFSTWSIPKSPDAFPKISAFFGGPWSVRITAAFPWTHLGLGMAPRCQEAVAALAQLSQKAWQATAVLKRMAELLGVQRVKRSSHGDMDSVTGSLSKISIHQGTGVYIYILFILYYIYTSG